MKKLALAGAVFLIGAFTLLPFLWFLLTSWKSAGEITAIPPVLLPRLRWDNYRAAIIQYSLVHYIVNSAVVATATTVISMFVASLAAFALARFKLPWARYYLMLLLALSMFPQIAIAGPVWRLLSFLGWLNSYHGIVAAYIAFALPFAVWVLTTFFRELPYDIEEAALIDGCTRWQALRLIVWPLAAPGVFTAAILVFIQAWNEFFRADHLDLSGAADAPGGHCAFSRRIHDALGEIAAASTLATLPLIALTLLFQRRIVQGLSAGAVKG